MVPTMSPWPPFWSTSISRWGRRGNHIRPAVGNRHGPYSLFATFSFQVPLRFGLLCAANAVANAATDKAAKIALRIFHFPFKQR